ncbi:hypothetical protein F511_18222 [Dorcoceras hygrometricum]|uniref:Uncharacterized protein n=1 Tax=Dorcoceras hygrometricum TaxID=472368 RepID=A0A2Z7BN23_9LAMI|nr:hypothetical protein F511_18222 [Dorcoceras hygrometricum]
MLVGFGPAVGRCAWCSHRMSLSVRISGWKDIRRCVGDDARTSGNTALSSPCWDLLATMRRVVNYHSSWVGQRQVELLMHLYPLQILDRKEKQLRNKTIPLVMVQWSKHGRE